MAETLLVIDPGSLTTVQDQGRFGWQSLGVPVSGALDSYAALAANLLVGNTRDAAVLEMTVTGMTLAVIRSTCLAVTGAKALIKVNAHRKSCWESFHVHPGDLVRIGQVTSGSRLYLAASGGIDVPLVMGSRSTSVGSGLGGFFGRPLRKGDILSVSLADALPEKRTMPDDYIPDMNRDTILRCLPGPQDHFFHDLESTLFQEPYIVTQHTDRRGVRLNGPQVQHNHDSPGRVLSEPSLPGNIQIPGDGFPIILLVEQTVGGYAKAATVLSRDLCRLAQTAPGSRIIFQCLSLPQAHKILNKFHKDILQLEQEMSL
ncbi:MAG: biotin-dependent carboxyltransferase family protein [Desulfovermiculus sp.]|nr:biotin-dependent carboxyltransferase family protein [Desulfovermiculus sp.]